MPKDTFYRLNDNKKNDILNAAIQEFSKRTVKDAKISNIILDSKISRGSFYQYFENIDDLYYYVIGYIRKIKIDYFQDFFFEEKHSFVERLRELYKKSVEFSNKNRLFVSIGRKHLDSSNLEGDLGYKKTIDDIEIGLIKWIQRDIDRGILRKDIDQRVLANISVTFLSLFLTEHVYYQILTLEELELKIDNIIKILEKGVLSNV